MTDRRRVGLLTGSWPLGLPPGSFYRDFAIEVEARGFDLLFSGDHLFMHNSNPDPLVVLGGYAGATDRVTLGTAVLLPALREPVVTAKQLATLDYLSGGRLVVGVGVGGEIVQEWEAMEIPHSERGARTDESLSLMRAFWSGEPLDFQGRFRTVRGVTGSPATVNPGGPPIWIGGRSDAALARASRHDGWCAYASSTSRIGRSIEQIAELRGGIMDDFRVSCVLFVCIAERREEARNMAAKVLGSRYAQEFEHFLDSLCAVGTAEDVAERVEQYRDAGVQDILFVPQVPWQDYLEQVAQIASALQLADGRSSPGAVIA